MEFLTANTKNRARWQVPRLHHRRRVRTSSSSAAAIPAPTAWALPSATAASPSSSSKSWPSPPAHPRRKDNPWPEWPKTYKVDYGQEEAAAKFGSDPRVYTHHRHPIRSRRLTATSRPSTPSRSSGRKNDKGQFMPVKRSPALKKSSPPNSFCSPWASSVPSSRLIESHRPRSRRPQQHQRRAREVHHQHPRRLRRRRLPSWSKSLVVWAFNEGRGVARECDKFLMGRTELP